VYSGRYTRFLAIRDAKICIFRYAGLMTSETILEASDTYQIIADSSVPGGRAIRCTVCYVKSYNPLHVEELYCGACRSSHARLARQLQAK
jgi:hypothetical protein